MNREELRSLAADTVSITQKGQYTCRGSRDISDIRELLESSRKNLRIVESYDVPAEGKNPAVSIADMTTLDGAWYLREKTGRKPCILVFASARHPGGGFLGGSMAQEEDIAYRSSLYVCLAPQTAFYQENERDLRNSLYPNRGILFPDLAVIRDRSYRLCAPWACDCAVVPAPNRGAALTKGVSELQIEKAVRERIRLSLGMMALSGAREIVAGAFGCGVFKNRPEFVARVFKEELSGGRWPFDQVLFAIPDQNSANFKTFKSVLGANAVAR